MTSSKFCFPYFSFITKKIDVCHRNFLLLVGSAGSLAVTGRAEDGTVEVVEDPSAPFVLGVQWHPEMADDPRLFEALVAAASSYRR